MMVSYATDGAYSMHNYGSSKYKAFIPNNKGYIQIEGMGIIKDGKNASLAKKFIDYSLTESFQNEIPLNQWMFPVIKIQLPDVYSYAIEPKEIITLSSELIEKNKEQWIMEWEKIMAGKK